MKISAAIEALQELRAQLGDVEVVFTDSEIDAVTPFADLFFPLDCVENTDLNRN